MGDNIALVEEVKSLMNSVIQNMLLRDGQRAGLGRVRSWEPVNLMGMGWFSFIGIMN